MENSNSSIPSVWSTALRWLVGCFFFTLQMSDFSSANPIEKINVRLEKCEGEGEGGEFNGEIETSFNCFGWNWNCHGEFVSTRAQCKKIRRRRRSIKITSGGIASGPYSVTYLTTYPQYIRWWFFKDALSKSLHAGQFSASSVIRNVDHSKIALVASNSNRNF